MVDYFICRLIFVGIEINNNNNLNAVFMIKILSFALKHFDILPLILWYKGMLPFVYKRKFVNNENIPQKYYLNKWPCLFIIA